MSGSAVNMVGLVEHLARAVVNVPEEVEVEAFDETGQTVLELWVAEDDLGRIIGRQGRMARSLRTIVDAAALRTRKRYRTWKLWNSRRVHHYRSRAAAPGSARRGGGGEMTRISLSDSKNVAFVRAGARRQPPGIELEEHWFHKGGVVVKLSV